MHKIKLTVQTAFIYKSLDALVVSEIKLCVYTWPYFLNLIHIYMSM